MPQTEADSLQPFRWHVGGVLAARQADRRMKAAFALAIVLLLGVLYCWLNGKLPALGDGQPIVASNSI